MLRLERVAESSYRRQNNIYDYKSLHDKIQSMETNISCMCYAWKGLLNLRTEDKTIFMTYYSAFKTNMEILNKGNSTIATNESFICIFLHKLIQIDCLPLLSTELLPDIHIHPLEMLKSMRFLIKANAASGSIHNDQSGSLILKQNIRQAKKNIPKEKSCFPPKEYE